MARFDGCDESYERLASGPRFVEIIREAGRAMLGLAQQTSYVLRSVGADGWTQGELRRMGREAFSTHYEKESERT